MTSPRVRGISAVLLAGLVAVTASCARSGGQDGTEPPPPPSAPPTSAPAELKAGEVVLDYPADEADVKQCEIFRGRANLPDGKTIVLAVRNKDNGSSERYFEAVEDWEYPTDLTTWTGAQWFGDKDSSAGQSFRVEVLVIDLALAKKMTRAAKKEGWHSPDNPPGATVAEHIDLHRKKGRGPAECS